MKGIQRMSRGPIVLHALALKYCAVDCRNEPGDDGMKEVGAADQRKVRHTYCVIGWSFSSSSGTPNSSRIALISF